MTTEFYLAGVLSSFIDLFLFSVPSNKSHELAVLGALDHGTLHRLRAEHLHAVGTLGDLAIERLEMRRLQGELRGLEIDFDAYDRVNEVLYPFWQS